MPQRCRLASGLMPVRAMNRMMNRVLRTCQNIWRLKVQNVVMLQAIATEVENVGGFMNAHTSREETAYYLRLLPEHLDLGVDILADILTESTRPLMKLSASVASSFRRLDNHLIRQMTWFLIYLPQPVTGGIVLAAPFLERLIVFRRSADRTLRHFCGGTMGQAKCFLCCWSVGSW